MLPQKLFQFGMAEHCNLLVGESTLGAITVPAEFVVSTILDIRIVIESLLRIHEESVGFSVVAKMGELEGENIILTTVSTYRMM